jgi:hypothetical protein
MSPGTSSVFATDLVERERAYREMHYEDLRLAGAEYLLVPSTAGWWLEYYSEFAEYLAYQNEVTIDKDVCVMYQLTDRGRPPLTADRHTGLKL